MKGGDSGFPRKISGIGSLLPGSTEKGGGDEATSLPMEVGMEDVDQVKDDGFEPSGTSGHDAESMDGGEDGPTPTRWIKDRHQYSRCVFYSDCCHRFPFV